MRGTFLLQLAYYYFCEKSKNKWPGSQLECSEIKFQRNEGHHLKLGLVKTCYLEQLVESLLNYTITFKLLVFANLLRGKLIYNIYCVSKFLPGLDKL